LTCTVVTKENQDGAKDYQGGRKHHALHGNGNIFLVMRRLKQWQNEAEVCERTTSDEHEKTNPPHFLDWPLVILVRRMVHVVVLFPYSWKGKTGG
jgi:hypothetical protein